MFAPLRVDALLSAPPAAADGRPLGRASSCEAAEGSPGIEPGLPSFSGASIAGADRVDSYACS